MWGEVACTLHVKSNITMFPTQLQKVYENLLLQFEQLYYYRSREKGTMQPPSQVSDAARLEPVKGNFFCWKFGGYGLMVTRNWTFNPLVCVWLVFHQFSLFEDYKLSLGSADRSDDSTGKRKFCDRSSPVITLHSNDRDGPVEKRKCKNDSSLVSTGLLFFIITKTYSSLSFRTSHWNVTFQESLMDLSCYSCRD